MLDKIKELSRDEQKMFSNDTIRTSLGWDIDSYNATKLELIDEKLVVVGRGKSGSIGLIAPPSETGAEALSVFISYSHVDEPLKDEIIKHLSPLKRMNLIKEWHDRKINAGDNLDREIASALKKADIILLLISIDFINSKYCYDIEMEEALRKDREGESKVIPIIVRNCMWRETKFRHLMATPTDGKAVSSWADRDDALTVVAESIKKCAEDILSTR